MWPSKLDRTNLVVTLFVVLVALFWGHYGITAKVASGAYHHDAVLVFLWVCVIYGIVGIPLSLGAIAVGWDHGSWTKKGNKWGIIGGVSTATGALSVVWAIKMSKSALVTMPVVFGPAQVFNFLFSLLVLVFIMKKSPKRWSWQFVVSFIGVVVATWGVQAFKSQKAMESINLEIAAWMLPALIGAACWGGYGVCARMAAQATQGSHFRTLFWVSLMYAIFGVGVYVFYVQGKYSLEELLNPVGMWFGILCGVMGLGGATFAIPANGMKGSPGPSVVMMWVFLLAAIVNSVGSLVYFGLDSQPPLIFWAFLVALPVCAFFVSKHNPQKPPAKAT